LKTLENDAVVDPVQAPAGSLEVGPRPLALAEVRDTDLGLDLLVFEEAQEHEAIERALYDLGQRFRIQVGVGFLERFRQRRAVFFQLRQKASVDRLIASLEQPALPGATLGLG